MIEEPGLERSARRFDASGARVLLAGGVLAALGGLIYLLGTETAAWVKALGAWCAYIATPITIVGLVLFGIGLVSHRASRHKPFA